MLKTFMTEFPWAHEWSFYENPIAENSGRVRCGNSREPSQILADICPRRQKPKSGLYTVMRSALLLTAFDQLVYMDRKCLNWLT
jgi:hypothetical protein